jgi:hypothetical protein
MVGAALLWVGWFGFNAGSALEANGFAALAFVNTFLATAAAVISGVPPAFGGSIGTNRPIATSVPMAMPSPPTLSLSLSFQKLLTGAGKTLNANNSHLI